MSQLPFEVGYVSTMSDDEMLSLAHELEREDFWFWEERIKKVVDTYIECFWSQWGSSALPYSVKITSALSSGATTTFKSIRIHVPQSMDERSARLIAELQCREQCDPNFDPTDDE